jgi:hypothetical protein
VFDGNKAQLFKDTDTQQDAFRKDSRSYCGRNTVLVGQGVCSKLYFRAVLSQFITTALLTRSQVIHKQK